MVHSIGLYTGYQLVTQMIYDWLHIYTIYIIADVFEYIHKFKIIMIHNILLLITEK